MAYIFDPLRNTFIDDEDTSLGNKLALLDDDLEKAIRELNEKFGPGTVQQGTEGIPTPPKTLEREMYEKAFKADGGRVNFQSGAEAASMAAEEFKTNVLPKYVKELERWIKKNAKKYNIKTLDKFYDDAVKHFNKPPYTGNPFGKNFVSEAKIKPSRLQAGKNINTFRLGDYAFKNLLSLSPTTSDATSKVRYVKDMMMIELIEKDPKVKKIFVDYYNGKPLGIRELATMNRFNKEFLRGGTVNRPNLLRKYFQNLNPNFEKIRADVAVFTDSVTKQIAALRDNPNLSPAMRKKYKEAYTSVRRMSDTFRTRFIKEYPKTLNKNAIDFQGNKIAKELFQFEHKAPRVSADLTNLPDSYLARTSMTPGTFNVLKMRDFDIPLDNLINEYQAANVKDRKKIETKINKLYDTFNKNSGGYLNELKISFNEKLGKVNLKDTTPMLKSKNINYDAFEKQVAKNIIHADTYYKNVNKDKFRYDRKTIKQLSENILKLKKHTDSKGFKVNSFAGFLDFIQSGIDLPPAIKQASENILETSGKFFKGLGKAAIVIDPIFAAFDESRASRRGAGSLDTAEYVTDRFIQEILNLPRSLEDLAYLATEEGTLKNFGQKENRFFDYKPFTFAEEELEKNLQKTSMDERVSNVMSDIASAGGYRSSKLADPEYLKIFESLSNEDIENRLKEEDAGLPQEVKPELSPIIKSLVTPDETLKDFMANGGRVGFSNGGAAGADEDFAAQLEYFFLNPNAELPAAQTFRETKNPISIINDMIDPRNFAYYADRLVQSGIRIGEFGARVLPAVGKLAADLIQKPAFKIKPASGQGYVQDYDEIFPSNITGTGIFSEFLNNLVGDEGTKAITEKTGLAKLIKDEEQKMKDRRATAGAKILADQVTLGMELTAPIFPGLKLLKAYAKNRNLPVDKTTREIMDKEIDEVLTKKGISRREFLQLTGAGATVAIAKLLGVGDDLATVTKVAEKVVPKGPIVPPYFFTLVDKIKRLGTDESKRFATMDREVVYVYKNYELYEDLTTGNIRINKKSGDPDFGYTEEEMVYTKGMGDETTQGTPADEYDEFTVRPDQDGKLKDIDSGLDDIEELIDEVGVENISIKDLEAMGYEIDRLPVSTQRKLGIQKPISPIDRALKTSDNDLPDLP